MSRFAPSRRAVAAGLLAALACAPVPARAAALSLAEISRYFSEQELVRGTFTQINADGSRATGTLSIRRPGRMRLEYDPPEEALVLASGGEVAIFDRKMGGAAERYPLRQTPLRYLLERNVNLAASGLVTRHASNGTITLINLEDPENRDLGSLELRFSHDPIQLTQWVLRNDQGETTVVLEDLQPQAELPNSLFSIQNALR